MGLHDATDLPAQSLCSADLEHRALAAGNLHGMDADATLRADAHDLARALAAALASPTILALVLAWHGILLVLAAGALRKLPVAKTTATLYALAARQCGASKPTSTTTTACHGILRLTMLAGALGAGTATIALADRLAALLRSLDLATLARLALCHVISP